MNKGRKKIDRARSMAIRWVADHTGYTSTYVRNIVNGTFQGGASEDVMKMYRAKYAELQKVLS